jgi:uncharacterized membrane protein
MAWLALILGIVAVCLAVSTRSEQARLQKQIEQLRGMLYKSQQKPQQPDAGQAVPKSAPADQPASAPTPDDRSSTLAHDAAGPRAYPAKEKTIPAWVKPVEADITPEPLEAATPPTHTPPAQTDTGKVFDRPAHAQRREASKQTIAPAGPKPKAKPKPVSLEERLGAGVYVWAGGIALMLAGAFMVKYSFDNNLLSPAARLAIVGAFGASMVLASLWVRSRADKVAAAICGAGVADMFATVLAATAYYHVLGPWAGFALMAVVTAVAVGMSLLHGQFVALLGLIGGFVTPTLIMSSDQHAWEATFTYLLLLEIGLAVVTRRRQWFGLSALTLLASVVSAAAYALFAWDTQSRGWLIVFVLGTSVVFVMNAARSAEQDTGKPTLMRRIWLSVGALGSSALLMALLVAQSHFSVLELAALGVLAAGALVLARLDRLYLPLTYLAAGLCGMMLLAWPISARVAGMAMVPTEFFLLALGYGLVFFAGGLGCVWRNTKPGLFAWLSAASALGFTVIAHLGQPHSLPESLSWWMVYTAVAAMTVIAAGLVKTTRITHGTRVIDAYAITAATLMTLAVWFGLEHPWVAPAWMGLAVVVAIIGVKLRLRWLVIPVGWLSAGSVALLVVPGPWDYDLPMRLVFNTMLAHYGLPALGFAVMAWVYHRDPWLWLRSACQALALVAATAAISLLVRLGFHPDALWQSTTGLIEWATYPAIWMAVGIVVLWRFKTESLNGLRKAAIGIGVVGLIAVVLHPLFLNNPLFVTADVGQMKVLNWLLYIYGVPCLLALGLARVMPKEAGVFKRVAGVVSLTLLFMLVTLEVRHGFSGQNMRWLASNDVALHEWATYGVAWMVLALLLWWAGRWRPGLEAAGAAVGLAGFVAALLGPVLIDNPLFSAADVGAVRGVNWLLYIYGLPCVLSALLAFRSGGRLRQLKPIGVTVSLLLLFALVSFQVRQGFVGSDLRLSLHPISSPENYSYSLAWVLLALALLGGGLMTGSASLRYGSLAVMLVAVGKVALDTAQLRDLWRVLSLLGLGLSLIVLGYVYQRYVFRRGPKLKPAGDEIEDTDEIETHGETESI